LPISIHGGMGSSIADAILDALRGTTDMPRFVENDALCQEATSQPTIRSPRRPDGSRPGQRIHFRRITYISHAAFVRPYRLEQRDYPLCRAMKACAAGQSDTYRTAHCMAAAGTGRR
jgi:hypothetical protein